MSFAYFPDIYKFGLYVLFGAVPMIEPSIYLLFLDAIELNDFSINLVVLGEIALHSM